MARDSLHFLRVQLQQNTTGLVFSWVCTINACLDLLYLSCDFYFFFLLLPIICCSCFHGANFFFTSTQSYSITVTRVNVIRYFPPLQLMIMSHHYSRIMMDKRDADEMLTESETICNAFINGTHKHTLKSLQTLAILTDQCNQEP